MIKQTRGRELGEFEGLEGGREDRGGRYKILYYSTCHRGVNPWATANESDVFRYSVESGVLLFLHTNDIINFGIIQACVGKPQ